MRDGLGDGQSAKFDPLAGLEPAVVETDVRSAGLLPCWKGELVPVGWQMADPVKDGRRPMGHDSLIRCPLPGRSIGGELKPCRAELEVVRDGGTGQVIHTVCDSLQNRSLGCETVERGPRDTGALRLTAGHEAPLVRGDLC
jgi:hypothetical protein